MSFLSNRKDRFKPGDFVYRIKDTERYGLGVVGDETFPDGVTGYVCVYWEYPLMKKANTLVQLERIENLIHANITCVKNVVVSSQTYLSVANVWNVKNFIKI